MKFFPSTWGQAIQPLYCSICSENGDPRVRGSTLTLTLSVRPDDSVIWRTTIGAEQLDAIIESGVLKREEEGLGLGDHQSGSNTQWVSLG